MEFRGIVSSLDALEAELRGLEEGALPYSAFAGVRAALADVTPRMSKCVARAKEPDPEKRLYGPAQAERVLAAAERLTALQGRADALEGRAAEAGAAAAAAAAAVQAAAEAEAVALAGAAAAAAAAEVAAATATRQAALAAAAAREEEAREAAALLEREAAARASARAQEQLRAEAALAAQKAAQEKEAQAAREEGLAREHAEHQRRVEVVIAAAQGARAGGGGASAPAALPAAGAGATLCTAGGGGGGFRGAVQDLYSAAALRQACAGAGAPRAAVLFFASWCARSSALRAPFAALARRFPALLFFACDVDVGAEAAMELGVGEAPALRLYAAAGAQAGSFASIEALEEALT
jgi:hypothetical protein